MNWCGGHALPHLPLILHDNILLSFYGSSAFEVAHVHAGFGAPSREVLVLRVVAMQGWAWVPGGEESGGGACWHSCFGRNRCSPPKRPRTLNPRP